jgi:hypothetical protein
MPRQLPIIAQSLLPEGIKDCPVFKKQPSGTLSDLEEIDRLRGASTDAEDH